MFSVVGLVLLAASSLEVDSKSELELRIRGEFTLASPAKPARFKAAGPGKLIAYVVPRAAGAAEPEVDLEVVAAGTRLFKEHLTATRVPGLLSTPRSDFSGGGVKRIAFDLLPKARVYEFKVGSPAAVSVFRLVQAPPGIHVPEVPVLPLAKGRRLTFSSPEKWQYASTCDHVGVSVPGSGTLRITTRTQLGLSNEEPPPTFLRAISEHKVKAAFPITSSAEPGLEFVTGTSRLGAGSPRTVSLSVPVPADYELDLAAWGCSEGVGLQFEFLPGVAEVALAPRGEPTHEGNAMVLEAQLPAYDGGVNATSVQGCQLAVEDVSRARALEYLDTMVASGIIPASELSLKQASELGGSFVIQSVWYALDGAVLFQKQNPEASGTLAARRVVPGPHALEVKVTLRGQGAGPFSYLNDYVIKMSKRESFVAQAGKKYALTVTLIDKGGFSTPFKERPDLKLAVSQ